MEQADIGLSEPFEAPFKPGMDTPKQSRRTAVSGSPMPLMLHQASRDTYFGSGLAKGTLPCQMEHGLMLVAMSVIVGR